MEPTRASGLVDGAEREARYWLMFEAMDEGVGIIERIESAPGRPIDFRCVLANPVFSALSGADDVVGMTMRDVLPGEPEEWFETYDAVLRTGQSTRFERDLVTIGRRVEVHAFRVDGGTRRRVAVVFRDITERARIEASLRESEERYRTLFESIDQGFCTLEVIFDDAGQPIDYRFLEVNPVFVRYTGLEEAVGKRMREFRLAHEQFWFDTYGRIARTGVPERFEHEAAELDRWYNVYAYRVGEPELRRVAVLFEDITERKRAELALRESRVELERQAQFLDATLSNVGDSISIWDRQARFVYANRALESLWGRTRIAYAGKSAAELGYSPDQTAFFEDSIARVFRTKRVVRGEMPYTSPAGMVGYL